MEHGVGPFAVVEAVERCGGFEFSFYLIKLQIGDSAASSLGPSPVALIGDEVLHGTEKVGAKLAALRLDAGQSAALEQLCKEGVGEISR